LAFGRLTPFQQAVRDSKGETNCGNTTDADGCAGYDDGFVLQPAAIHVEPERTSPFAWKIYSVSTEGGGAQQLTPGERNEADPCWSSEGDLITFDDLEAPFAIHVLELKTGQISTLFGSEGLWAPLWSPDGKFIAAKRHGTEELMIFDVGTKKRELLTHATAGYFRWSRDGKYIYLVGQ
jgi:Tol biopolymer transport system component